MGQNDEFQIKVTNTKSPYFPLSNRISRKWHLCTRFPKGLSLRQENPGGQTPSRAAGVPPTPLCRELDCVCQQCRRTRNGKPGISERCFLWWVYLCGAQRNHRELHCVPEWSLLSTKLPDDWEAKGWNLCPWGLWWVAHRGRAVSSAGKATVRKVPGPNAHSWVKLNVRLSVEDCFS